MTASLSITPPDHPLVGRVTPPGSKSITNRALLLAALAKGTSHLTGALKSKDTQLMAAALRQMGVAVDEPDDTSFVAPILALIPVQLLAYHTAVFMGTDVDQPRNLAKSVTVE